MGVTRTWTLICDVCTNTVVSDGGSLPKQWIRLFRRTLGGAKDETVHCCGFDCAADVIESWEDEWQLVNST